MKLHENDLLYIDAHFRTEAIFHNANTSSLISILVNHLPVGYQYGCTVLPDWEILQSRVATGPVTPYLFHPSLTKAGCPIPATQMLPLYDSSENHAFYHLWLGHEATPHYDTESVQLLVCWIEDTTTNMQASGK